MSIEGREAPTADALSTPGVPVRLGRVESSQLHAYLLDVDDDLCADIDVRMRFAARHMVTAKVLDAECGGCDLEPWLAAAGRGPGLLLVNGLMAVDTCIAERTSTELLGAGDLLAPALHRDEEMVESRCSWRALEGTRFALLDSEFLDRTRPWPQIVKSLLSRAERRAEDLALLRVIASHPRLEVRLVLLLWHLGGRWGRVEPTGLRLTLPLTHRLLGQLVAAERPSVTHALSRLSDTGVVTGATTDLHLNGSLDANLHTLARPHAKVTPLLAQRRLPRHRVG